MILLIFVIFLTVVSVVGYFWLADMDQEILEISQSINVLEAEVEKWTVEVEKWTVELHEPEALSAVYAAWR